MKSFVKFKTLFSHADDRTIEQLSSIYTDREKLFQVIDEITLKSLPKEKVFGKKVLLKPNWVKHNSLQQDEICLRTNDQFVLATLEVILLKRPKSVVLGDAPIQGCNWEKMIKPSFIIEVKNLSEKYNIQIEILDFRRVTFDPAHNDLVLGRRPLSDYVIFDIGKASYLEPISKGNKNLFRVTDYNPDRLAESHSPGIHKYCITKELFDADVIISLPKVKTHQKAGITAALKNIVGLNGDKDFLPHHRLGGKSRGGDCYPGNNLLRYLSELASDNSNRNQGKKVFWYWQKISSILWRLSFPRAEHSLSAAWYGNDTTWRMVLDLNKIAIYGKADGTLSSIPQRQLFSLCDGIIGGQADGPLRPKPLALGIICFTNNSTAADINLATLMGFDPEVISMLTEAKKNDPMADVELYWNNDKINITKIKEYAISTEPPPGWVKYLNMNSGLLKTINSLDEH